MDILGAVRSLRERLSERRGKFQEIALASGLSHSWLSKFAAGRCVNPTIESLQQLSDALSSMDQNDPPDTAAA